jgi:hypothetical protein
VGHFPRGRHGRYHLLTQGLDDALGGNLPGAPKHDTRVAVAAPQCPLGILELHLLILVLLQIHLLFALPLTGRCAILAWLLLFLTELFRELLELSALS